MKKVEQVKSDLNAVENPHNPLHEALKDSNGCRLVRGKSWMVQAKDSILQTCQLTELKQGVGKGTQIDSGVSMKHSCRTKWGNTVKNGLQAKQSQIKLLIQENGKSCLHSVR